MLVLLYTVIMKKPHESEMIRVLCPFCYSFTVASFDYVFYPKVINNGAIQPVQTICLGDYMEYESGCSLLVTMRFQIVF